MNYISGIGIILTLLYVIDLYVSILTKRLSDFKWHCFNALICISLFSNVGTWMFNSSINNTAMYLYLLTCLMMYCGGYERFSLKKNVVIGSVIALIGVCVGLVHLLYASNLPYVIMMNTSMDDVFYGKDLVSRAVFSENNLAAFKYFIIFLLCLLCSNKYFNNKIYVMKLLENVKIFFLVFFIWCFVEFIINNVLGAHALRDCTLALLGNFDPEAVQYPKSRYGDFIGVTGLFSEQSYISVIIVLYAIEMVLGIKTSKDRMIHFMSMIACILSGSTTGIYMLLLGVYITYREFVPHSKKITRKDVLRFSMVCMLLLVGGLYVVTNIESFVDVINTNVSKLGAYVSGEYSTDGNSRSAATRTLGNLIAFNAFLETPLFGVGIGTTRGYGIIVGMLACFGIFGILTYAFFLYKVFDISLRNKLKVFLIVILYFSIILSVWYVYMFALVPLWLTFNKNINHYKVYNDTNNNLL